MESSELLRLFKVSDEIRATLSTVDASSCPTDAILANLERYKIA